MKPYGSLCSLFYDAIEGYAPQHEVNFYATQINQSPGRALEAMSGSGRLQIPLLQRGYTVDGVDSSSAMLTRCRERCTALGLQPDIYHQSLEQLNTGKLYTIAIIPFGSFQLITDHTSALQALKRIAAHLHPGGALLVDLFTPDQNVSQRATHTTRIDQRTTIELTTRRIFNHETALVQAFCTYSLFVDGIYQYCEEEIEEVTWYSDQEFETLLNQAGFVQTAVYDQSFRSASSSRIVKAIKLP